MGHLPTLKIKVPLDANCYVEVSCMKFLSFGHMYSLYVSSISRLLVTENIITLISLALCFTFSFVTMGIKSKTTLSPHTVLPRLTPKLMEQHSLYFEDPCYLYLQVYK